MSNFRQHVQELLAPFRPYLIGTGRSRATTESYYRDTVQYLVFLAQTDPDLQQIEFKKLTLSTFIYELTERGLKKSTIQRMMMGVFAFWEYLYEMGLADQPKNLKELKIRIKPVNNPTKPLSKEEFNRFIGGLEDELSAIE